MKLSQVVAKFLEAQNIMHVFAVNGGANLHLLHGIVDATSIRLIPATHECNAGFAADAYARLRGLGCAMATSGPGATNLITAIATSYYDSVPVLYITGAVATHRQSERFGVRQYGFQDTPIVAMVANITKFAILVHDAQAIRRTMQYALERATDGRKGPVLIEIPDDVQRADI